jgi:hypothetical protein
VTAATRRSSTSANLERLAWTVKFPLIVLACLILKRHTAAEGPGKHGDYDGFEYIVYSLNGTTLLLSQELTGIG